MADSKKASKLIEFVGHEKPVGCVAIGRNSARLMASGGHDHLVKVWAIGKPEPMMSLAGHTSAVESVKFDVGELNVCAGSVSGTLKLWDLQQAKVVRTLTGHKSSIRSLDFHPFGAFIASGSLDTNLKVWDIRRKGCIQTYKGHTEVINSIRFSPDGRWVVSGSDDGVVKLWDLTAGKMITEFKDHSGPITTMEFHPNEFLLATGSADRTCRFFDLETFSCVCATSTEASKVRAIAFHPEGKALYSGGQDSIRSYSWEPYGCLDSAPVGWGKLADLHSLDSSRLLAASFNQEMISVWVADLTRINCDRSKPMAPGEDYMPASDESAPLVVARAPSNLNVMKPSTAQPSIPEVKEKEKEKPPATAAAARSTAGAAGVVRQAPKRTTATGAGRALPHIDTNISKEDAFGRRSKLASENSVDEDVPSKAAEASAPRTAQPRAPVPVVPLPSNMFAPPQTAAPAVQHQAPAPTPAAIASSFSNLSIGAPAAPKAAAGHAPRLSSEHEHARWNKTFDKVEIAPTRDTSMELDFNAFLPTPVSAANALSVEKGEEEVMASLQSGHASMIAVMQSRLRNIRVVRGIWGEGDYKRALDLLVDMEDNASLVDILNIMHSKPDIWTLELAVTVLPTFENLINSPYEAYIQAACNAATTILKSFGPLILSNIAQPPGGMTDISREERFERCSACYESFVNIKQAATARAGDDKGKIGSALRKLLKALDGF